MVGITTWKLLAAKLYTQIIGLDYGDNCCSSPTFSLLGHKNAFLLFYMWVIGRDVYEVTTEIHCLLYPLPHLLATTISLWLEIISQIWSKCLLMTFHRSPVFYLLVYVNDIIIITTGFESRGLFFLKLKSLSLRRV